LFFISSSSFFYSSETEGLSLKERQRDETERSGERCPEIEGDQEMGTDSHVDRRRWDQDPNSGGSDRDETERESRRRYDRSRTLW
jgi:hypothetical protein